jgi:SAM-dependent methyltransferase
MPGCSTSAAARALRRARSSPRADLRVTGIDFARVPTAAEPQIRLLSDTPMESMPFADASFDAAIGQFGFEYGRIHKAARELARVLAPGGTFSLVVHHAGSSIVATNRARLNALLALQQDEMRAAFLSGSVIALSAEMGSLQREYPGDTLVAELARVLPPRARMAGRERSAAWTAVEVALAPEQAILEVLDSCCVAPEEIDGWLGPLHQFCAVTNVSVLRKAGGQPIAWQIDGFQRSACFT